MKEKRVSMFLICIFLNVFFRRIDLRFKFIVKILLSFKRICSVYPVCVVSIAKFNL